MAAMIAVKKCDFSEDFYLLPSFYPIHTSLRYCAVTAHAAWHYECADRSERSENSSLGFPGKTYSDNLAYHMLTVNSV